MTTPTRPRPGTDDWPQDLADVLGPWAFPSRRDDLVALLIRHHAPSHLMWHLSVLHPQREFGCLDELVEAVTESAPLRGHLVAEPL